MAYSIQTRAVFLEGEQDWIPVLEFEPDRIEADPDDLVQQGRRSGQESKRDRCVQWIEETLRQWGGR